MGGGGERGEGEKEDSSEKDNEPGGERCGNRGECESTKGMLPRI